MVTRGRNDDPWGLGLFTFIIDLGKLVAAVAIVGGLIWGAALRMFPEYVELPQKLADLKILVEGLAEGQAALEEKIVAITPAPSFLQFRYGAAVFPTEVKAGESITIVYVLRRTLSCDATVTVRFWSAALRGVVSDFIRVVPAVRSPTSSEFSMWALDLVLPTGMAPGYWAYQPEIRCGEMVSEFVPPALFKVLE